MTTSTGPSGARRAAQRVLQALALLAVASAALVGGVVFDGWLGRWGIAGWLLALLLVPLGAGVAIESVALRWKRVMRAERVMLHAAPLLSALSTGLWLFVFPSVTANAFAGIRMDGWLGDRGRDFGELLGGRARPRSRGAASANPDSAGPASASTSAGRRPGRKAPAPTSTTLPSSSSPAPSAGPRFSAGDPTYDEPDCGPLDDLSDLERAHQPGALRTSAEELTRRRYPVGLPFLQAQDDTTLSVWFTGGTGTLDGVASRLDAAIHEGSHLWAAKKLNGRTATYRVNDSLSVEVRWAATFPRSEIARHHVDAASDSYLDTYLTGASGEQRFATLLDEYNAYAHTLAARYCLRDRVPSNQRVSARDGILTLMYYVEVYLWLARTEHPSDYQAIVADPGARKMITAVWDRAELWLRRSAALPQLGIHDEVIEGWVYVPERLAEVERVRQASR